MLRTALVVLVQEADPLADDRRRRHLAEAAARGLQPHITSLRGVRSFVPRRPGHGDSLA